MSEQSPGPAPQPDESGDDGTGGYRTGSYGTASPDEVSGPGTYGTVSPTTSAYGGPSTSAYGGPSTSAYGGTSYGTGGPSTTPLPPAGWWATPSTPAAAGGGPGDPLGSGFLGSLFDLSFTRFVTPSIVRLAYLVVMVAIGAVWLGYSLVLLVQSPLLGLLVLVLGAVVSLVYLVLARVGLEAVIALIRVAEDVREIKEQGVTRSGPR